MKYAWQGAILLGAFILFIQILEWADTYIFNNHFCYN